MTQVVKAKHIIGDIVLDEHGTIVAHPSKKQVPLADSDSWPRVLKAVKDPRFFTSFRENNIAFTKKQVKESVSPDQFIIQSISAIEELDRLANMLSKRLREWAGWWVPETSRILHDHASFARAVAEQDQQTLLAEARETPEHSMGAVLSEKDIAPIKAQAAAICQAAATRLQHESYLKSVMQEACPNLTCLAGHMIGAKLLAHAGSLRRLAEMPSSTVQMLGAEKALFRHMRTGARPPKYGVIFSHPLIQSGKRADQGRIARAIADKISIGVRVDFFKGRFVGDRLKNELELRFHA